jgi:hypothetical protein
MSVTMAVHHALREESCWTRDTGRCPLITPIEKFFALGASLNLGAATAYTAWLWISGPSD